MRKSVSAVACVSLFGASLLMSSDAFGAEQRGLTSRILRKAALYVPNRVLDIIDMVGVNVSFGVSTQANVHATRFVQLGVAQGQAHRVGTMGRQMGVVDERNRELLAGPWGYQKVRHEGLWGTWEDIDVDIRGWFWDVPVEARRVWGHKQDRLGIGATLHALLVGAQVEVRPREMADFVLSIIGIDLTKDDWE